MVGGVIGRGGGLHGRALVLVRYQPHPLTLLDGGQGAFVKVDGSCSSSCTSNSSSGGNRSRSGSNGSAGSSRRSSRSV